MREHFTLCAVLLQLRSLEVLTLLDIKGRGDMSRTFCIRELLLSLLQRYLFFSVAYTCLLVYLGLLIFLEEFCHFIGRILD